MFSKINNFLKQSSHHLLRISYYPALAHLSGDNILFCGGTYKNQTVDKWLNSRCVSLFNYINDDYRVGWSVYKGGRG